MRGTPNRTVSGARRLSSFLSATSVLVVATLTGAATLAGSVFWASGSASAKGPSFSGAPIVVATEAPVGTFVSLPQIWAGVKAAARAINAAGGIHGHRVDVITCNGRIDPNAEANCASSAVAAGAVAMVGSLIAMNPPGVEQALQAGNTADLAPEAGFVQQYNATNAFPLFFLNGEAAACTSPSLSKAVGEKVRFGSATFESSGSQLVGQVLSNSAQAQGGRSVKAVGKVANGLFTTDFSPLVSQLSNLGSNFVFLDLVITQTPAFITAATAAGKTWGYCAIDGSLTGAQLKQFGPSFTKYYTGSPFPPLSAASHYPELKLFIKQMRAEQATGDSAASTTESDYNSVALNAWLGMQVLDQVAGSIKGPIDHNSFLAALKTSKVDLGVTAPINFAHPIGSGMYPHVFNAKQYLLHWNPAKKQQELVPGGVVANSFTLAGIG